MVLAMRYKCKKKHVKPHCDVTNILMIVKIKGTIILESNQPDFKGKIVANRISGGWESQDFIQNALEKLYV